MFNDNLMDTVLMDDNDLAGYSIFTQLIFTCLYTSYFVSLMPQYLIHHRVRLVISMKGKVPLMECFTILCPCVYLSRVTKDH